MALRTQVQHPPPRSGEVVLPPGRQDVTDPGTPVAWRAWDLRPGDHFHGRTVAAVHAVVGLASSPVAVISFTGDDQAHPRPARIGATRTSGDRGPDELDCLARRWVRDHGLIEGQALDLAQLRHDVLIAIVHHRCVPGTA